VIMSSEVMSALADELRRMTDGFVDELAVAWPVHESAIGAPIIAAVGDEHEVSVAPERLFRYALRVGASGVVLAHNHSRTTGPSNADRAVTRRLVAAGHVLGIPLLAHLVVEPNAVHELVGGHCEVTAGAEA
jgi:DNA repair protein RadC